MHDPSEKGAEFLFGEPAVANDLLQERSGEIAGMHRDSRDDFPGSWAHIVTVAAQLVTDDKSSPPQCPVHLGGRAAAPSGGLWHFHSYAERHII